MPEELSLAQLLQDAFEHGVMDLHTAMPGMIQKYDATKQVADIVPQLNHAVSDAAGGYVSEQLPVLPNVPVCFPRGGGFFASFPLQQGDFVLVVFSQRDLNVWRSVGHQTDTGDLEMHGLSGAMAIPCNLYPAAKALTTADAANAVFGRDGGAQIHMTPDDKVLIGGKGATLGVARQTDPVDCGTLSATVTSGFISALAWVPPGGGPPTTIATTPAVTALTGKISDASKTVKAT